MKADVKQKWLTALRSGEYRQGRTVLRHDDNIGPAYCCLGVLCDLYRQESAYEWVAPATGAGDYKFLGESAWLPDIVMDWAGLESDGGTYDRYVDNFNSIEWSLVDDNDGRDGRDPLDFKAIADIIEQEF